jgi:hypothetical protein
MPTGKPHNRAIHSAAHAAAEKHIQAAAPVFKPTSIKTSNKS